MICPLKETGDIYSVIWAEKMAEIIDVAKNVLSYKTV